MSNLDLILADRKIKELTTEVVLLRAALEKITKVDDDYDTSEWFSGKIARAALEDRPCK